MPAPLKPLRVGALAMALLAGCGSLRAAMPATEVANSALDAQLFYQLLIGEIELRSGAPGAAYDVMLDAARRTRDEQLFRRAADIALQARAGDKALAAVQAWRQALPQSADAHRYLVQLLVVLDRADETVEPLRSLLALTPPAERPALIDGLPRFFARSNERQHAASLIEQVLKDHLEASATRVAASVALGRAWLAVPDAARAAQLAARAHEFEPAAESPAVLAIETLPGQKQAEAVVIDHLRAKPDSNTVRQLYARMLTLAQRYVDAVAQLDELVARKPDSPQPLLTLGALHIELRQPAQAIDVLQRYLALVQKGGTSESDAGADRDDDDARGPTQAYLLLAQAAEQQRDFGAAEGWLAKIDSPQRALEVQSRRASLLARQGRIAEARALIRAAPAKTDADQRARLLAEAQLLREARRWADANAVLGEANQRFAGDTELLYEQSMILEKMDRLDDMERLLRRVIEIKPDHQHAYNALGYSLADRGVRLPEAKALIQKALEISPNEPFITDSLGWVEFRLGNRDEALRLLRAAYRARPDPEIAAHLGEVLWSAGQRDEARRVWREARGRDASNEVLRETLARLKVDL